MNNSLFKIILSLIPVIGVIITTFVVPFIKQKISSEKLSQYQEWAMIAVKAAEMIWTETGHGQDKKAYVVDFLNNIFNSKKEVISEQQINALIEAAVQEIKNISIK